MTCKTDSAKEWTDIMNDIFWDQLDWRILSLNTENTQRHQTESRLGSRTLHLAAQLWPEVKLLCFINQISTWQTATYQWLKHRHKHSIQISCNNTHKIKTQVGTSTPWTLKSLQPQHPLHSCRHHVFGRSWPLCQWHQWCILGWAAACAHTPVDQAGTALSLFCCA